jgi:DNA mismatch repair protein MutS2
MPAPPGLETRIGECIAENGEVRDSASPELQKTRADKKVAHGRLLDKLNSILASERYRALVQEPIITVREGRYCVPVKSENRSQFGGIIHDASTSGATVFVEPGPCIELGNKLKELAVREEQEVSRILTRLTGLVGRGADDLDAMLGILANLDLANARAALADEMAAAEPSEDRHGAVRLINARHPLLTGDVVPIDLEVGDQFEVLLLTGPNTGGKTVALKTVGLLALMRQCGMQTPCSPNSTLPLFEHVFADIGDEQDIQQSLSTFSAHLRNIVRIVRALGCDDRLGGSLALPGPRTAGAGHALVLLDEIGAGTDPAEGAALAKAILSALQRSSARVIATTHYGELKEYAYTAAGVENAAVEFDRESLRPTYRVLVGVPGSSHAFYIARRLGLPDAVVDEAEGRLSARERDTSEMLQQIEASRGRAYTHERDAAAALKAADAARAEYERRARQVADVQRTIRKEVEEEARTVLRRASDKAEGILDELRRMQKGSRKAPQARKKMAALRQEVTECLAVPEPEPEEPLPAGGYVPAKGDAVRVVTLGADGVVITDPADGVAQVQIGPMRATLPLDVLRPARREPRPPAKRDQSGASQISMRKALHIAPEIMIRAMRVEEAQPMLDKYMDDAYAAGLHEARIIHGKGTGVLRKFVQEYLRSHPLASSHRPGDDPEGGGGVTVVTFKE